MHHALAIDVGGTKLAVGIVDARGEVRAHESVRTAGVDAEALFATLLALIDKVRALDGPTGPRPLAACGVGCGGPMEPGGVTVSPLNIAQWIGFPLRDRLAASLGLPVFIDNDAKALALGEAWQGAARGERNFLAIVVSTGVGGGIVVDGHLLDGAHANAGHIGHVVAVPGGRWCACGARGCLEAEASGRSIEAFTGRPARDAPDAVRIRTGRLVARWSVRWCICSTYGWQWSQVRSRWDSANLFSMRRRPDSSARPGCRSRVGRASCPPASARWVRWSGLLR